MQTIQNSRLSSLVITDTINNYEDKNVKIISVGKLFAEAIRRVHHDESISVLFR